MEYTIIWMRVFLRLERVCKAQNIDSVIINVCYFGDVYRNPVDQYFENCDII